MLVDHRLELVEIDIPFERLHGGRVVGGVDYDVDESASGELLVEPGGGEVHVARHHVAGLDENLAEDVLGAPALMGGDRFGISVDVGNRFTQVAERPAPGVGLVAHHQAGPHVLGHRRGPRVGEQVDVDVF